ncbi:MAG: efflux RND transporter periplasmic adaptor subunit [Desulfotomaculum sp.]|nr:efflux RND transporter periplasmic adaptor subunit [Desulfotomaculum sp.]
MKAFKSKISIAVLIIVLAVLAGTAGYIHIKHDHKKPVSVPEVAITPVRVVTATVINLQETLERTAEIKPAAAVNVFPKIPGKIVKKLPVQTGDYIKKGSLIAELEKDVIHAQLAEAKAGITAVRAGIRKSEAHLELLTKDKLRVENLYAAGAVPKQKLDHINAKHKVAAESKKLAQAQLESAEAVLNQLQVLYRNHNIAAPISGFVSMRFMEQGDITGAEQPLVRISREDELKVVCHITEEHFPRLEKGMPATITVDAFPGEVFEGAISIISPTINPATRTAAIEVHIPNQDHRLRSGMFARLKLYLDERKALVIPADALNRIPGTGVYFVYVIEHDRALLKNVATGLRQDDLIEITSGLTEKDLVVTWGKEHLYDGAVVSIEERGVVKQ